MKFLKDYIIVFALILLFMSCSSTSKKQSGAEKATETSVVNIVMDFNADSAYKFVKAQTDFGPRVPNTESHSKTASYLAGELKRLGTKVTVQATKLKTFDGTTINAKNIIGEINPDSSKRILLLAHWDSRPWADNDPDLSKRKKPVMGANDGASGVGVILELARLFKAKSPNIGIDILFVDAEDWGDSNSNYDTESTWALGTQYWIEHMHRDNYEPIYGILLDMVGSKDAKFYKDYYSMEYAPQITNTVWDIARDSGYADYFVNKDGGGITDDHVFVNKAGIKCIDIIDQNSGSSNSGFCPQWHTTFDTMDNISTETLKAVGQTLTNLIYQY